MSPIEELSQPKDYAGDDNGWTVLAHNSRVNKSWEALMKQSPENTRRCYEHHRARPMQRIRGRVFPMRHRRYRDRGAWEYELTGGDRVFYVPRSMDRTVLVYYAGEHPPKGEAPSPPMFL